MFLSPTPDPQLRSLLSGDFSSAGCEMASLGQVHDHTGHAEKPEQDTEQDKKLVPDTQNYEMLLLQHCYSAVCGTVARINFV